MARSVLEIILTLKGDKATRELKKVDKELGKVDKSASKSGRQLTMFDKNLGKIDKTAKKTGRELDRVDKSLSNVDRAAKKSGRGFSGLKAETLAMGAAVVGAVAGAVALGKALWNMGKRGAAVIQTGESFEFLSKKLGLMPDLLDQLREASRGTVDDMTLMSGTATLLAGTSDELGKALGDATPRLMEIAKAANKLNPSLGTTAFMYESIATGVKRAQPLILDNLGLTLKVGTANEKYAKSLGKTVDQLTAEEKAMAILNATLEAGDTMIAQVGGNTESAADEFAIMETNIANLKDEMAKGLAPAISDVVEETTNLVKVAFSAIDAWGALDKAWAAGLITTQEMARFQDEYMRGLIDTDDVLRELAIKQKEYEWSLGITNATTEEAIRLVHILEGEWSALQAQIALNRWELIGLDPWMANYIGTLDDTSEATLKVINNTVGLAEAFAKITGDIGGAKDQLGAYQKAVKAVTDTETEALRMKFLLELATWDLEHSTDELTAAEKKERSALLEATLNRIDAIDRMEKLIVALDEGKISELEYIGAIADGIVTEEEFNRVLGITDDELHEVESGLGRAEVAAGGLSGQLFTSTTPAVDGLFTSLETAAAQASLLEDGLIGASGEYSASFKVHVEPYTLPKIFGPPAPKGPYVPPPPKEYEEEPPPWRGQRGLDFTVPQGYSNDSFIAPLALSSGEHVTVTPKGKQQGNVSYSKTYIRGGDNNYAFIQNSAAWAVWFEDRRQAELDDIDQVL